MFFALPMLTVIGVYVLAAILPALFLMGYIYKKRQGRQGAAGAAAVACVYGRRGGAGVDSARVSRGKYSQRFYKPQQPALYDSPRVSRGRGCRRGHQSFFFLYKRTWHDYNFNYRFDGVVYAVFVSLGFAAFENIKYVFGYGLSVSVPRAFLAIPGHMGFAVFMGTFYGTAKLCQSRGHRFGKFINLLTGYLAAVLLHGFYDSCAMIGSGMSTTLFVAFVVIMYIVVIAMIKKESASDRPV
jgi:RsiW-degrading membrane proteinase PrsW (M82 family)